MSKFSFSKLLAQNIALPAHTSFVASRRDKRIAENILSLLPDRDFLGLDIGCGSGNIAKLMQEFSPRIRMQGSDSLVRPNAMIPVTQCSGEKLSFSDGSFDFAILVDVLHHTDDPFPVLSEAIRVSREFVIIKDHYCQNKLDRRLLQFMDWVGNRAHDVTLPFNYLSKNQWNDLFTRSGVLAEKEIPYLGLYSQPFSLIFDRELHFMAKLKKASKHV